MATSSRKGSRIFFRSKEAAAGTADTYAFFEGRSIVADFPAATYLGESDKGKLGSGEHGTKNELQAVFVPVTFKCSRLSEVAYFLSFFQGAAYTAGTPMTGVYTHELKHLPVATRTLPTFTWEYGNDVTAMDRFTHTLINEFSLTLAAGGNGIIDATFSGFCNLHYLSAGVITRNATVNNSAFSGTSFASEPLINFRSCLFYMGAQLDESSSSDTNSASESSEDRIGDIDVTSSTNLTSVLNTITITGNNGMSGEDLMRAGGYGILNTQERGDRTYTLEFAVRKDTTNFDALALARTMKAFQLTFDGPQIGATGQSYGIDFYFPSVYITGVTQDGGSPISETIATEVCEDSDKNAFYALAQSAVTVSYNATNT